MPSQGFLGTGASLSADVTLAIEIAMGVTLVIGMLLARRRKYRAHAWCQSTVVVLNLIVIAQVMVPAFRSQVAPKIPARLARPYYAMATAHATMGCIAELLAVYIILSAGTRILPEGLRFVRYKLWMRTALVVWWLALLLGLTTYVRWYVAPKQIPPRSPSSSRVPLAGGRFNASMGSTALVSGPAGKRGYRVRLNSANHQWGRTHPRRLLVELGSLRAPEPGNWPEGPTSSRTSRLLCSVGTKGRHDDFGHTR